MNNLHTFQKKAGTIVATGIGLSVGAGVVSELGGNAAPINTLAKGLSPISSLVVADAVLSSLPKKRRY